MGANIVRRIMKDGHHVVFDRSTESVTALAAEARRPRRASRISSPSWTSRAWPG